MYNTNAINNGNAKTQISSFLKANLKKQNKTKTSLKLVPILPAFFFSPGVHLKGEQGNTL